MGSASRRIALIVEYDGTGYSGFQYQKAAATIQQRLEEALAHLTQARVRVHGAGRTDAGVHAKGQVVAFDTESTLPRSTFVSGLNHFLPADIAVQRAFSVDRTFDPRQRAKSRVYRYTLLRRRTPSPLRERYAYRVSRPMDVDAMRIALKSLEGRHDFVRLSTAVEKGKSTVRHVVATRLWEEGELVQFEVEANAFLPHQMRRIAGLLISVGTHKMPLQAVPAVVQGCPGEEYVQQIPTVSPQGLCLMDVRYEEFPPYEDETNNDL